MMRAECKYRKPVNHDKINTVKQFEIFIHQTIKFMVCIPSLPQDYRKIKKHQLHLLLLQKFLACLQKYLISVLSTFTMGFAIKNVLITL